MPSEFTLRLHGPHAEAAAGVLEEKLRELGTAFTRDGLAFVFEDSPEPGAREEEAGANDSPGFAADKLLDLLEALGIVRLDDSGLSPKEEARMHARLKHLGYIE